MLLTITSHTLRPRVQPPLTRSVTPANLHYRPARISPSPLRGTFYRYARITEDSLTPISTLIQPTPRGSPVSSRLLFRFPALVLPRRGGDVFDVASSVRTSGSRFGTHV